MDRTKISRLLRKARFRIALPFFSYEVTLDDVLNSKDVDARIQRLDVIRHDLEETVQAVVALQEEAFQKKREADQLKSAVEQLKQDKDVTEAMLGLPEDSFARVLSKASSKGRARGIIEGVLIGLVTGAISSYLVWLMTR